MRGVDLPHFRYGDNSQGVGAGEGKEGDSVGKGKGGGKQGGTESGQHIMEVDLTLDELADILAEELKLPRIEPKGKHRISRFGKDKYSSLRKVVVRNRCGTSSDHSARQLKPGLNHEWGL